MRASSDLKNRPFYKLKHHFSLEEERERKKERRIERKRRRKSGKSI
jgi:hypothetical protein